MSKPISIEALLALPPEQREAAFRASLVDDWQDDMPPEVVAEILAWADRSTDRSDEIAEAS